MVPPVLSVVSDVSEIESVRGHLAHETTERARGDDELWQAYRRLADCYQELVLSFSWIRRRQVAILTAVVVGQTTVACAVAVLLWRAFR